MCWTGHLIWHISSTLTKQTFKYHQKSLALGSSLGTQGLRPLSVWQEFLTCQLKRFSVLCFWSHKIRLPIPVFWSHHFFFHIYSCFLARCAYLSIAADSWVLWLASERTEWNFIEHFGMSLSTISHRLWT